MTVCFEVRMVKWNYTIIYVFGCVDICSTFGLQITYRIDIFVKILDDHFRTEHTN